MLFRGLRCASIGALFGCIAFSDDAAAFVPAIHRLPLVGKSPVRTGWTTGSTCIREATDLRMATWSDMKAVQDYQNFLATGKQEVETTDDGPSVIIKPADGNGGSSELAEALAGMGMGDDLTITPDQDIPAAIGRDDEVSEFPIYVTLPPGQLNDFLRNLPESYKDRMEDFVFFSGGLKHGNIEDVLKERGYCRDSMTQVLISGMRITPLKTAQDRAVSLGLGENGEEKWAGACTSCGKWAGSIAERMERSDVRCDVDFYREWRRRMWEQSVLDAVFHLLGVVRSEPTTVGDVAKYYEQEASDMVWEMSQLLRGWRAVTLLYGFEERMFGVAETVGSETPCTLDDEMYPYVWGNPVFLESKLFVEYLQLSQTDKGLLPTIELPNRSDDEYTTKMRQGNLRADGVI